MLILPLITCIRLRTCARMHQHTHTLAAAVLKQVPCLYQAVEHLNVPQLS